MSSLSACFFPRPCLHPSFKCYIWCSVSELSSENLRTCFQIVNAYLYLSATEFLQVRDIHSHTHILIQINIRCIELPHDHVIFSPQNYAESLCRFFCDLLKDITNEGQVQVLKVLSVHLSHTQNNILFIFFSHLSGFIFFIFKFHHSACLFCLCHPVNSRCIRSGIKCCRHININTDSAAYEFTPDYNARGALILLTSILLSYILLFNKCSIWQFSLDLCFVDHKILLDRLGIQVKSSGTVLLVCILKAQAMLMPLAVINLKEGLLFRSFLWLAMLNFV